MTIAIAFNGGSYGTYLEWCLTTLTTTGADQLPFTEVGSSHRFAGNHLLNISRWDKYLDSHKNYQFARLHPKTQMQDSLNDNMNRLCNTADSVIYLYPDPGSVLLSINNSMSKIWEDWWSVQFSQYINADKIYQNWPVSMDLTIDQIPVWIRREFLSYYLMPAWYDQVEWYHPANWSHPNACVITIKELLFEFEHTLIKIKNHCGIRYIKPIQDILPYHRENLSRQKFLDDDQLCKKIIYSTLNSLNFDWPVLSLGSESWIQWELRNQGFEIRCHGLDIFPTNSLQLKELLYSL